MDGVDYAAIVIGLLLLGLVTTIIIVALLIKKGIIYTNNNKQLTIRPALLRPISKVSSLNTSLYQHSSDLGVVSKQGASITPRSYTDKKNKQLLDTDAVTLNTSLYRYRLMDGMSKGNNSTTPRSNSENKSEAEKDPIIYLHDDIYHPPGSLPLPPYGKMKYDETDSFYGIYEHKKQPRKYRSRPRRASNQHVDESPVNCAAPHDNGISAIAAFGKCDPHCDVRDRDRKHSALY